MSADNVIAAYIKINVKFLHLTSLLGKLLIYRSKESNALIKLLVKLRLTEYNYHYKKAHHLCEKLKMFFQLPF